jgi:hypothetical protein
VKAAKETDPYLGTSLLGNQKKEGGQHETPPIPLRKQEEEVY